MELERITDQYISKQTKDNIQFNPNYFVDDEIRVKHIDTRLNNN